MPLTIAAMSAGQRNSMVSTFTVTLMVPLSAAIRDIPGDDPDPGLSVDERKVNSHDDS